MVLVELGGAHEDATALARSLRDEGTEVIHAGVLHTADEVACTVEQEDPDLLGLLPAAGTRAAAADLATIIAPWARVAVLDATTDVTDWVREGAICVMDTSTAGNS